MKRVFLLLSLLVLSCVPTPVFAGDTDVDAIGHYDQQGVTGVPVRKIGASFDMAITPAEWSACRAAALSGLTAFDAWVAGSGHSAESKAMYANMPPMWRDAVRRGALGLAP